MEQQTSENHNMMNDIFWKTAEENGFVSEGYDIHAKMEESEDIKISKFGGLVPCLPNEEVPTCNKCGQPLEIITQFYIPSLPPKIRKLFPSDLQKSLIVLFLCTNLENMDCFIFQSGSEPVTRIYNENEISLLIYKNNRKEQKLISSAIFSHFTPRKQIPEAFVDSCWMSIFQYSQYQRLTPPSQDNFGYNYFGGFPYYGNVVDDNPGSDYHLILSLNYGDEFTYLWGDAGCAQIWMRNDDSHQFLLTWSS